MSESANEFVKIMKKAANEVFIVNKPCNFLFGTVRSIVPISVEVEQQKVPLGELQLVIPKCLTSYSVQMTFEGRSTTATINNSLKVGDKVVLLQKQGGQQFLILDRLVQI